MIAGVVVLESQPFPQREPSVIALLIAAVSSADPSPLALLSAISMVVNVSMVDLPIVHDIAEDFVT